MGRVIGESNEKRFKNLCHRVEFTHRHEFDVMFLEALKFRKGRPISRVALRGATGNDQEYRP